MNKTPPINCPKCKKGILFNVTSKLAQALGLMQLQCDRCGHKQGHVINPNQE